MLAGRKLEIPLGFEDEHVGQAWASLWQWPPEVLAHQAGKVSSALGVVKAAQAPRSGIPHRMHHQELIPLVPYTYLGAFLPLGSSPASGWEAATAKG